MFKYAFFSENFPYMSKCQYLISVTAVNYLKKPNIFEKPQRELQMKSGLVPQTKTAY